MDRSYAGRVIDRAFIRDLPRGIDPCGENGEFHTFVFDGPVFSGPVPFTIGETVYREYSRPDQDAGSSSATAVGQMGFWFCDLIPG